MLRTLLLLWAVAGLAMPALLGADNTERLKLSDLWNPASYGQHGKVENGALILMPADEPWGRVAATSGIVVPFWNQTGLTMTLRVRFNVSAAGEAADTTSFIGLASGAPLDTMQSCDNVVGLSLGYNKAKRSLQVGLSRKERNGPVERTRGDQWGNLVTYASNGSGVQIPIADDTALVSFTISQDKISASVEGTSYSESYPQGLTRDLWRKPVLMAQCMNYNAGRGTIAIDRIVLKYARPVGSHIHALDLRPLMNMGLRDDTAGDQKGGWTDQGDNDLRHLATGTQAIRSLPFDIVDPATNGGKSCIMLYSTARDYFPREAGPLAVNAKADSLLFLHSAAWAKTQATAASYKVTYDDGSTSTIPIEVGKQVADWWSMADVSDPNAALLLKVQSDQSMSGQVGVYGYRWMNPHPEKAIRTLSFASAGGEPTVGVLAVSLVAPDIDDDERETLKVAWMREAPDDFLRNPPDKDQVSDQVFVKQEKKIGPDAFSVAGSYAGGGGGAKILDLKSYIDLIRSFGGIVRFPYGLEISFYFWPYEASDWYDVLGAKGGNYGVIERWYYKYGGPRSTLSYQTMLAAYKKDNLKLILQLNTHAMFDGKDFVYVKTLPEEKMRKQSPMEEGKFRQENLDGIVRNNGTLVDYVIAKGYADTVAYWEMDNERWDMPGREYAELVAAHVKMLHSKLPDAKVIVCLGELGPFTYNPKGTHAIVWSRDLLARLRELGMNEQISFFAPHLYPFLADSADKVTANYLEDWYVRNTTRSLDYMSDMLDEFGFSSSKLFISEWGAQSDILGDQSHNELITSMAAALGTAKQMMATYAHPRVYGGTWHQFLHASWVSKEAQKPIGRWGEQTIFVFDNGRIITTPPAEAVRMFTQFCRQGTLVPSKLDVPKGVHCLCVKDDGSTRYFIVNSTGDAVPLSLPGMSKRTSLFADRVTATSILKYDTYGDQPGEVQEILPREFGDQILPPYSINVLK